MIDMSILAIIRWAGRQAIENVPAKNVLNAIATYANRAGAAHPSQRELAEQTGYSERAVRMALALLEAEGFITRKERRRGNGSRTSDGLQLVLDRDAHNRQDVPVVSADGAVVTGATCQAPRNLMPTSPARDSGPTTFEQPGEQPKEQPKENSGPDGPAPQDGAIPPGFRKDLFDRGVRIIRDRTGRPEVRCRALIGSWLGLVSEDAATVLAAIDAAVTEEVAEPVSWIEARLKRRGGETMYEAMKADGYFADAPRPKAYKPRPANGAIGLFLNRMAGQPSQEAPDAVRDVHNAKAMEMAMRGEWPVGGRVFVERDATEGRAWEEHFARFGTRPRWLPLDRGVGAYMPSPWPPGGPAEAQNGA
ncbi:helix-turn-helix domain-containing protein [Methylobacterium sp. J-070]|uniref:helix-turn-helix domain-containing protein n=1 Tax=Methylobacterium sp. J-070 TaxID=2836650 RepID=UPI001FB8CFD8|nr:helix-turn-helix domain-containing protein [Methylobacterium sp. J-070]MCJ2051202.1 helix-turn-helix domain-containing protein [Methylobacterium sp. J-070]